MMTGLMYYRPDDHVDYLQTCLNKIKSDGPDKVCVSESSHSMPLLKKA